MGRERRVTGRKDLTITLAFKIWLRQSRCRAAWPIRLGHQHHTSGSTVGENKLDRMWQGDLYCLIFSILVTLPV